MSIATLKPVEQLILIDFGKIMNHWRKLKLSLRKRFLRFTGNRFLVKRVGGITYLLDIKNKVDRFVEGDGGYEKEQQSYLAHLMVEHECDAFFDIGAHWGYYSLVMQQVPGLQNMEITAFEPDRKNVFQLYANLFLNHLEDRISVIEVGLSDKDGEASFSRNHPGNRGASSISEAGKSVVTISRFDSLYEFKGRRLCFKIDVEGHELAVLSGMSNTLRENNCLLQVELFEDGRSAFINQIAILGYKNTHSIGNDYYFMK